MRRTHFSIVCIVVTIGVLAGLALVVAGDDSMRPTVMVPEDVPGADVIIFLGDEYTFDLSKSYDDVGIVEYIVEFEDGGNPVTISSSTGVMKYTFGSYSQTWVKAVALDAAGNEGVAFFAVDVVERVSSDLVIQNDGGYLLDHSLYMDGGSLTIDNSTVGFGDGAGLGPTVGVGGTPEMLGDSLTPSVAGLEGHWEPYYWYTQWRTGSTTYGRPDLDTSTKMSGPASIKVSGGTTYGFEYHFDVNADLTKYNALYFWVHSSYSSSSNYMYYLYFYGSHDYSSTYGYAYTYSGCMYSGGYSHYRGWHGYTIVLDMTNFGYWYRYNMNDLSSVACIRFYMNGVSSSYTRWIDNVGLYTAEWGDEITESTTPTGDYGGYWSGCSLSQNSIVGSFSVSTTLQYQTYNNIYYYFNKPTDLSAFSALRFFMSMQDSLGQQVSYTYYWPYSQYYNMYVYDSNGKYCYYYAYPNQYTFYGNGWKWFAHSLPWGTQAAYSNTGVDLTKVSYVRFANIYVSYANPGNYPLTAFIDGLEWYSPTQGMQKGAAPDNVALAIYSNGGDVTISGGSRVVGLGSTGARILVEGGSATISDATFENMWHTEGSVVANALGTYGGLEVYGDASIRNVRFTNCEGTGLALFDGKYNLDGSTIDLSGTGLTVEGAPMLILGVTHRTTGPYTVDLTGWTLQNSKAGSGVLVMLVDCPSAVTVSVHDNFVDGNAASGIVVSADGCRDDLTIKVASQDIRGCGTDLLLSVSHHTAPSGKRVSISVDDCAFERSKGAGALLSLDGVDASLDMVVKNSTFSDNGESGLLMTAKDVSGPASIRIEGCTGAKNKKDGASLSLEGWTGNTTVEVKDGMFDANTANGLSVIVKQGAAMDGTSVDLSFYSCTFEDNIANGLMVGTDGTDTVLIGALWDLEAQRNSGAGLAISVAKTAGNVTFRLRDSTSRENMGSGLLILTSQENTADLAADANVLIELDRCSFVENSGDGVAEGHYYKADAAKLPRPTMTYHLVARNLTLSSNDGNGYYVGPSGSPANGIRDALYEFKDTLFKYNEMAGMRIEEGYNNDNLQGYSREAFDLANCTFAYNGIGLEQYWNRGSYGTISAVTIDRCTFDDNEAEALYAHGYSSAYSGESCLLSAEYTILGSDFDGPVLLDISGAYDLNGAAYPTITVTMVNNTYDSDKPVTISLGAYYNTVKTPLQATVVYRSNKHMSSSLADGLYIAMLGGAKLSGVIEMEDITIDNSIGSGVKVVYGTLLNSDTQRKLAIMQISLTDVTIKNSLVNALDIEEQHKFETEAYARGKYTLLRVDMQGAVNGITSEGMGGELRECRFSRITDSALNVRDGIVDVYDSDVGPVTRDNLVTNEAGAIRLWFSLDLKTVWGNTGLPVYGASMEVRDNTLAIIGVSIINSPDAVSFGNLNTITVDFAGIITRNPYTVTVDFRGITREETVNVTKRTSVTVLMFDDVPPRLTIETPRDGTMQNTRTTLVKGRVYDMHSALDKVLVSIDGETWLEANGTDVFRLALQDLPEGFVVVRVRAFDAAGNYQEALVSLLVDTTPPALDLITPTDGMRTRGRTIEIIGTTDVGARVFINGQEVDLAYTLISHTIPLNEGPNVIKVSVMDPLGNERVQVINVERDTLGPYLALLNPQDGAVLNTDNVHLEGLTEPSGVTVQVMGLIVPVDNTGRFGVDIILVPGHNTIEMVAIDDVGNERHLYVTLTLDNEPPWLRVEVPLPSSIYNTRTVTITGYASEGARVYIDGREVQVVLGQFRADLLFPEGAAEIQVLAVDGAGNENQLVIPILVDTIPPGLEVTSPVNGLVTNVRELRVEGMIPASEDLKELALSINGVPYAIGIDGSISQVIMLEEGANQVIVTVVDQGGNRVTIERNVVYDPTPPHLSVVVENTRVDPYLTDPVSMGNFVYVTGYTEVGTSLTVNGVFVQVDPVNGQFRYTLYLPLPEPGYKVSRTLIHVVSTDPAGNVAVHDEWVNRLQGEAVEEETTSDNTTMVLVFALIILVLSAVVVLLYQRYRESSDVLEGDDEHGSGAIVEVPVAAEELPPPRPTRGHHVKSGKPGRTEEETEVDDDDEEVS